MAENILVVDDQKEVCALLEEVLSGGQRRVTCLTEAERALAAVAAHPGRFNLVILDLDFGPGRMGGLEALDRLRELDPNLPVIILSGKGTVATAVQAIKRGAVDFLEKDTYLEKKIEASMGRVHRLLEAIEEVRRLREQNRSLRQEADYYRKKAEVGYRIVGVSQALKQVLEKAARLARLPRPVLVRGERGTGKELVAHAIHQQSQRASGPFITVNCAAIPEGLLECELFGQEESAFHGAPFKLGRFDLANKGTLFLDEVGNMGEEFQKKILRVIEYQRFERVAGTKQIAVDVRIIAATNTDLEQAMSQGRFREDLYDRLAFDTIFIPPLRQRPEDIQPLAYYFMERFAQEVAGLRPKQISPQALALLRSHPFPGNVRELKNIVERLMCRVEGDEILPEHVEPEICPRRLEVQR